MDPSRTKNFRKIYRIIMSSLCAVMVIYLVFTYLNAKKARRPEKAVQSNTPPVKWEVVQSAGKNPLLLRVETGRRLFLQGRAVEADSLEARVSRLLSGDSSAVLSIETGPGITMKEIYEILSQLENLPVRKIFYASGE